MKELECPNCAGADPETISAGEFRCKFCGTLYYNENMRKQKIADEKRAASIRAQELSYQSKIAHTSATRKSGRNVLLFVGITLLLVLGLIGYLAKQATDQQNKMQEEIIDQQKKMQEEMMKNF